MAEFCINDNGIGIDENLYKNLFSLSRNMTKEGTDGESGSGLGLFLCKDFIERNRGNIWCNSKFNVGTSFYFVVPLVQKNENEGQN
jgi:signal transduction histidine kinase